MSNSGWWFPLNSRKAHFMVGGRSLCGRWMCLGAPDLGEDDGGKAGPDDCKACFGKLEKRREALALHAKGGE